jgi:hypothetical protein
MYLSCSHRYYNLNNFAFFPFLIWTQLFQISWITNYWKPKSFFFFFFKLLFLNWDMTLEPIYYPIYFLKWFFLFWIPVICWEKSTLPEFSRFQRSIILFARAIDLDIYLINLLLRVWPKDLRFANRLKARKLFKLSRMSY